MKILSIFFVLLCVGVACNSDISYSPQISIFVNTSSVNSVEEDSIVHVPCVISAYDKSVLKRIQMKHNKTIVYDTLISNTTDFSHVFTYSFLGLQGLQKLTLYAFDNQDLYSEQTIQYFVKELQSPSLILDSTNIYKDTIIHKLQTAEFSILCKQGERMLDSLYVYHNSIKQTSYPNIQNSIFTDSITRIPYTCNFSKTGIYIVRFRLLDKAKKTTQKQVKITVVE
ncbi:MAG TPA: hypothetical protein P5243_11060 [Bacteroidales bacterium]|nr:hypothetical protein [Bacteroidales bacterium]HRS20035.1 hypothetical protein [Bacteroidales bacterium]